MITFAFVTPTPISINSFTSFVNNNLKSGSQGSSALGLKVLQKKRCQFQNISRACIEQPDPNTSLNDIEESLVEAAMMGDEEFVKKLLTSENSINVSYASTKSLSRMTPLHWAAAEGHLKISEELMKKGADINAKLTDGLTALILALENAPNYNPRNAPPAGYGNSKTLSNKNKKIPKQTPIISKRITGHIDVALLLLENGADWYNSKNNIGESCLHLACRRSQLSIIKKLLIQGAKINDQNNLGKDTPLHIAAKEDHIEIVQFLCDLNANVNLLNVFNWSPLIIASASGHTEIVKILIQAGADVNVKGSDSKPGNGITTALKEARKSSNPGEISKLLIRAGAIE